MHQLSVTSDIDSVMSCVKYSDKIKTDVRKNTLTFSSDNKQEIETFKENLANAITSVIETKYRAAIINRILDSDHMYLTPDDKGTVFSSFYGKSGRCTDLIFSKLYDFLDKSDTISIEGFVNFRLPEYKAQLRLDVDRAVRKFLAEREYNEFIDLLGHFVSYQPPKEKQLHISVTPNGGFSIYDSSFRDITGECAKLIADSFSGDELSFDDILLSALITISPLRITFHNASFIKTPNLLETIERIFNGRVNYCEGCHLCRIKQ